MTNTTPKIFSASHVRTREQLPSELVLGRAYFIDNEQIIIINHGQGPVIYGNRPGPQGKAGEPIPILQAQIDNLVDASITQLSLIANHEEARQSDNQALHDDIDNVFFDLSDSIANVKTNLENNISQVNNNLLDEIFTLGQDLENDINAVDIKRVGDNDFLSEQINLNAQGIITLTKLTSRQHDALKKDIDSINSYQETLSQGVRNNSQVITALNDNDTQLQKDISNVNDTRENNKNFLQEQINHCAQGIINLTSIAEKNNTQFKDVINHIETERQADNTIFHEQIKECAGSIITITKILGELVTDIQDLKKKVANISTGENNNDAPSQDTGKLYTLTTADGYKWIVHEDASGVMQFTLESYEPTNAHITISDSNGNNWDVSQITIDEHGETLTLKLNDASQYTITTDQGYSWDVIENEDGTLTFTQIL